MRFSSIGADFEVSHGVLGKSNASVAGDSRGSMVEIQKTAEACLLSNAPDDGADLLGRRDQSIPDALVVPLGIVVSAILRQRSTQGLRTEEHKPVEAFRLYGEHEPFGYGRNWERTPESGRASRPAPRRIALKP